jgi:site-specific recombinase XerC
MTGWYILDVIRKYRGRRNIWVALGCTPARKAPATADRILAMVANAGTDLKGLRDRAMLLLGFAGAFRRSELVALDIADLEFCAGGVRVCIRKSKTDQEGFGATIAVARGSIACPVDALRIWIKEAGILDGALFRPVTRTGKISPRRLSTRTVAETREKLCAPCWSKGGGF